MDSCVPGPGDQPLLPPEHQVEDDEGSGLEELLFDEEEEEEAEERVDVTDVEDDDEETQEDEEEEEDDGAGGAPAIDGGLPVPKCGPCVDTETPSTLAYLQFVKLILDLGLSDKQANDLLHFMRLPQANMLPLSMRTIRKYLGIRPEDVETMIKKATIDIPEKAQKVLGGPRSVPLVYRCPVTLAVRSLTHSIFAKNPANLQLEVEEGQAGILGDLCTGTHWKEEQAAQRERFADLDAKEGTITTLMPLLLHSDKTTLDEHGRTTAWPVTMQLCNLRGESQRRSCSRELVALLPILDSTAAQGVTAVTAAKRFIMHKAMKIILANITKHAEKGIILEIHDTKRRFVPYILGLCADADEALRIAHVKPSCKTHCPCYVCYCRGPKLSSNDAIVA
jgi:hypothetical protein